MSYLQNTSYTIQQLSVQGTLIILLYLMPHALFHILFQQLEESQSQSQSTLVIIASGSADFGQLMELLDFTFASVFFSR